MIKIIIISIIINGGISRREKSKSQNIKERASLQQNLDHMVFLSSKAVSSLLAPPTSSALPSSAWTRRKTLAKLMVPPYVGGPPPPLTDEDVCYNDANDMPSTSAS